MCISDTVINARKCDVSEIIDNFRGKFNCFLSVQNNNLAEIDLCENTLGETSKFSIQSCRNWQFSVAFSEINSLLITTKNY